MLNKTKGNMYDFVTHTWNVIKGKCPHGCVYCYMKRFPQKDLRFDDKELKVNLGDDNFIFVGSSCDMFAEEISDKWILNIINHCKKFPNTYLFQSKNPKRFLDFSFPKQTIFGTTIESNIDHEGFSGGASIKERIDAMLKLKDQGYSTMVTIEPIMDFDVTELVNLVSFATWVNIGADSGNNNLPEPSAEKVLRLIDLLKQSGVEVKKKINLKRLLK
jgi:DNA repair photolyase